MAPKRTADDSNEQRDKNRRPIPTEQDQSPHSCQGVRDQCIQTDAEQPSHTLDADLPSLPTRAELTLLVEDPTLCQPPHNIPEELLKMCRKGNVLLVCKDDKAVQCHSPILSIISDVLEGLFESCNAPACSVSMNGASTEPRLIPVMEDEAHIWLLALQYVYPLVSPTAALSPSEVVGLALLGHKYNIPKVMQVVEGYIRRLRAEHPAHGYYKWIVPNAEHLLLVADESCEHRSPEFLIGGHKWRLGIDVCMEAFMDERLLCIFCELIAYPDSQEAPDSSGAAVSFALLSRTKPLSESRVYRRGNEILYEADHMIEACKDIWESGVFLKDDTLEVLVYIGVAAGSSAENDIAVDGPVFFSLDEGEGCVFKWLQLAQKINNTELEEKCIECIGRNTPYVVFSSRFSDNLHRAVQSLTSGQLFRLMQLTPEQIRGQ